jgi:UrcA family protein
MNSNVKTDNWVSLVFSTAMLLACMLVVSNASADDQVRTETVTFRDLNVDATADVNTLYDRIHSAAERVCFQPDPRLQLLASACARRAEAQAVERVNLPLLTAYYQFKTGRHTQTLSANR